MNSHSFTNTDFNGNSKKLYTKLGEQNPEFNGKTLIETVQGFDPYFKDNKSWLFDGDTIEFTTLRFFNNTLEETLSELEEIQTTFVQRLNYTFEKLGIFQEHGKVKIIKENHPFVVYLTNFSNVSMFNNGTLHYNLTLPTLLNEKNMITNFETFKNQHSMAIKLIQWIEPFLVAVYGSPDILSNNCESYSKASQRCAVSRYISIGTYDSDTMKQGKILTVDDLKDTHWYNLYYTECGYTKLDKVGTDINFNKHYNHGIELRFFDHLLKERIKESFEFIIYLMDYLLEKGCSIENPIHNEIWNNFVLNIIKHGKNYRLTKKEKKVYKKLFGNLKGETVNEIYYFLYSKFFLKFNKIIKKKVYKKGNDLNEPLLNNSQQVYPEGKFSSLVLTARPLEFKIKKRIFNCF
jgi:hypothetical protein